MSANEKFLTGAENKLFTFNQARERANDIMGTKLSLASFGELLGLSSVRPACVTAAAEPSGLYTPEQVAQFCVEFEDPKSPVKQKAKGRPATTKKLTAAEYAEYEALRAAARAAEPEPEAAAEPQVDATEPTV